MLRVELLHIFVQHLPNFLELEFWSRFNRWVCVWSWESRRYRNRRRLEWRFISCWWNWLDWGLVSWRYGRSRLTYEIEFRILGGVHFGIERRKRAWDNTLSWFDEWTAWLIVVGEGCIDSIWRYVAGVDFVFDCSAIVSKTDYWFWIETGSIASNYIISTCSNDWASAWDVIWVCKYDGSCYFLAVDWFGLDCRGCGDVAWLDNLRGGHRFG